MEEHFKNRIDVVAICAWIAAATGWLPSIAAALSIIWTAIRIYETKTVQQLITRLRQ